MRETERQKDKGGRGKKKRARLGPALVRNCYTVQKKKKTPKNKMANNEFKKPTKVHRSGIRK